MLKTEKGIITERQCLELEKNPRENLIQTPS